MKAKIDRMEKTFGGIAADPASVVPAVLKAITRGRDYVDFDTIWTDTKNADTKEEAEAFVNDICGNFVESIIVSSGGMWMFVTQAEAYMRGKREIDDCSNTTITIDHPTKPKFVIEQKREFQNQWLEAKVYYKNFEFLVTGCLCGNYDDDEDINAFLGASLGNSITPDDYWRVYVPPTPTTAIRQSRLPRDFTKTASGYQWQLISRRCHEKGFSTACALELHALNGENSIVTIGSLLLSWKAWDQEDKQKLRSMLSNVEELSEMDADATSECVETVESFGIAKGKKLALKIVVLVLSDDDVKDAEYVEMYKSLISSKLGTLNKAPIRQKKYLLQ